MAIKPTIATPIVEFDIRNIGFGYNDGDTVTDWEDLVTSNQQGRTDARGAQAGSAGTPSFVKDGWFPGTDAVRFGTPTPEALAHLSGGIGANDWTGVAYTIFGVMQAVDIANFAVLYGSNTGLSPLFPKKTALFVQPDGSVVFHHTDEVSPQPGSDFSIETATGLVSAGDKLLFAATADSVLGKVLRINRVEVGKNALALTRFTQEFSAPALGRAQPQEVPDVTGSITGDDRLIVWLSAYGSLASPAEILQMEAFLFQEFFKTEWTSCSPNPGTVWT